MKQINRHQSELSSEPVSHKDATRNILAFAQRSCVAEFDGAQSPYSRCRVVFMAA